GGSGCVDLCSLAAGRVDAYYERGVQAWDIAAGALIVQEAGGRVEGLHGAPASPELTIAAGPGTFEALHELLVPLDPLRDRKSTRLNSSHVKISYAVLCLKKKKHKNL